MHCDENDLNNRFEERGRQGRLVNDPSTWPGAEDWLRQESRTFHESISGKMQLCAKKKRKRS
jgi:hypothetical protein